MMKRFGYFVKLGGDAEIAAALARGAEGALVPARGCEAVRRVAMMQHSPEEWARMTRRARRKYGRNPVYPAPARWALVGYAYLCLGVGAAWRWLRDGLGVG